MNIIKRMRWGNAFSYGPNNEIDFSASPITQLVGSNGHGKSSIALILEEALYNKNSKGVKKGDILNRHSKEKKYWIEVDVEVDGVDYTIRTDRSNTTQSVKLLCGDTDISNHTSTATYKQIESLLGMDHETFAQIVYQSHAGSLEFLTSTDSVRKKFLVELLNLTKYTEYGEKFKSSASEISKEVDKLGALIDSTESRLNKLEKQDRTLEEFVEVPDGSRLDSLQRQRAEYGLSLANIEEFNNKITNNLKFINQLGKLPVVSPPETVAIVVDDLPELVDTLDIQTKIATLKHSKEAASKAILKIRGLKGVCPTCLAPIDANHTHDLESEQQQNINSAETELAELDSKLQAIQVANAEIKKIKADREKVFSKHLAEKTAYEEYLNKKALLEAKIDYSLPKELATVDSLSLEITELESQINAINSAIKTAEAKNKAAEIHNAKVAVIEGQIKEAKEELVDLRQKYQVCSETLYRRSVLAKAFSNNGLIAYKIESLVKDLEDITNEYLSELSDGRFSISFQIAASDKLNVVINDNGNDIDISALSGGERARVNAATLLAIRRLMQSLSGNRVNLLILDETIEALDQHGKEKLVEVLIQQEHLNTFIISHGFTHPLLDKVFVTKQQNQSRLER